MRIRTFVCAVAGLLLAPITASAAFVLTVPEITVNRRPDVATTVNVDIFFSEVDPGVHLAGFAVRLDLSGISGMHFPTQKPTGLALSPTDPHPYIFAQAGDDGGGDPAPSRPAIPANDEAYGPTTITVAALADVGREPEIGLNQGVLRVPIVIEPDARGAVGALILDPLVTSFADPDGLPIPVNLDNGFIIGPDFPEPSSFALFALCAGVLAAARRRRTA